MPPSRLNRVRLPSVWQPLRLVMDSLHLDNLRAHVARLDSALGRRLEWGLFGQWQYRWRKSLQERWNTPVPLLGSPVFHSRDLMWTVMMSQEDQHPYPNDRLFDLALAVADRARRVDLSWLAARSRAQERQFVNHWPGEHYRLLAACVGHLQPRLVVEIGTFTGLSALAMKSHLPDGGRVVTYDIAPWSTFSDTALNADDFDGQLEQRVGDLSDPAFFVGQTETLASADLILLDGPKDGAFEPKFLDLYLPIFGQQDTILIIDDIRFVSMIQLWRDLPHPKLDITSFGHWTGTGLVVSTGTSRKIP